MKVVQINATCGKGSTGKICVEISMLLNERKIENYILYSGSESDYPQGIRFGTASQIKFESLRSHINGLYGFNSRHITKKILRQLDIIQPDIVHLHNLHGHNCHLGILLGYLRKHHIKVFWTFHDCWAFTAYCPHFTMVKCDRWKCGCHDCPQYREYSFVFDRSKKLYGLKRSAISGLDLTVIAPSKWLADLAKESFFGEYPINVIHNGIDLDIFRPVSSDFRKKHNIPDNVHILLGVAFDWGVRKGLDVFAELSSRLPSDKYKIVLVGTNSEIDKSLPKNILAIHRTANQEELAEIYSAADVFVNPTREEVLGLVNVEALACGTPVVTFDTGGCPEVIDSKSGVAVACDDTDALEMEIIRVCEKHPFTAENCIERAKQFDKDKKFFEYIRLYETAD